MVRKIVRLSLAFLIVLGLTGWSPGNNILKGSIIMLEGQDTPKERIRLWVARIGSNTEGTLYEVDDMQRFSIELVEDGEYQIEGVVVNDPGFYTKQMRVVLEKGTIKDNKEFVLEFELMNID